MANEIQFRTGMVITKAGIVRFRSPNFGFNADMAGNRGPTPGTIHVSKDGTDVSFAQLSALGGPAFIMNCQDPVADPTNFVTFGIWDPSTSRLHLDLELLPGEGFPIRFSRYIGSKFIGTGTGVAASNLTLRIKAALAAGADVMIAAFDK